MEIEDSAKKLNKLVKILGRFSLTNNLGFWYTYALYKTARDDALKLKQINENKIKKFDEEIKLYINDYQIRNKIAI